MLNSSLNNRSLSKILNLKVHNREALEEITLFLIRERQEVLEEMASEEKQTAIYRNQGKVEILQELIKLFDKPENFKQLLQR